eukprot:7231980-Heterocapsa_arctica.AAC.1
MQEEDAAMGPSPNHSGNHPGLGIQPGLALDFTTLDEFGNPWDFDDAKQRERAMERVRREESQLLIGSP